MEEGFYASVVEILAINEVALAIEGPDSFERQEMFGAFFERASGEVEPSVVDTGLDGLDEVGCLAGELQEHFGGTDEGFWGMTGEANPELFDVDGLVGHDQVEQEAIDGIEAFPGELKDFERGLEVTFGGAEIAFFPAGGGGEGFVGEIVVIDDIHVPEGDGGGDKPEASHAEGLEVCDELGEGFGSVGEIVAAEPAEELQKRRLGVVAGDNDGSADIFGLVDERGGNLIKEPPWDDVSRFRIGAWRVKNWGLGSGQGGEPAEHPRVPGQLPGLVDGLDHEPVKAEGWVGLDGVGEDQKPGF